MHFAHEGIVNLAARERNSFEAKRRDGYWRLCRECGGMAEGYEGKSHLALRIDVEQAIHGVIDESANHFGREAQGRADRQKVAEKGAVVPAEVAVGAVLILPGVAPVGGGADDGQWGVSDGGLRGRGFDQDAAIVSGAKLAQAEFGGGKVIDAGFEVGEVPADQVELDLVQCSRAGSGAKVDFASRIFSVPGDAGREVEELGDCLEIRGGRGLWGNDFGNGGKGCDSGLADFGGQRRRIECRVDLEGDRLVAKVQGMLVGADADVGVLGGVVIGQRGVEILVIGHEPFGKVVTSILKDCKWADLRPHSEGA